MAVMDEVLHGWPWLALVAAVALTAVLWRRSGPGRWTDPVFALGLLWPMYLVHQFEEHGVDLLGRRFSFLAELCQVLGHADTTSCPADPAFIFAVNVVGCQLAFGLSFAARATRPLVAAFGWSIPMVNAFAHLGPAIGHGRYNPGLFTAVALFVPLSVVMVRSMLRAGLMTRGQVVLVIVAGVALHVVLIGSLGLAERGAIDRAALLVINGANGALPLVVGALVGRRR